MKIMEYMYIRNDLKVSKISLGTWAIGGGSWWGETDDKSSIRTIHAAIEKGINFIDTAPVYGFGHSEKILGKAIKGKRNNVILSTKCGIWFDSMEGSFFFERDGYRVYKNLSKSAIKLGIEKSMKNLCTDYIDVLFTHFQSVEPFKTPINETMEALNELKKEGKIRAIGVSNITKPQVEEYLRYGDIDIIQEKYSLLDRRLDEEIIPVALENNIPVQVFSILEKGILAGKFQKGYIPQKYSARDNEIFSNVKKVNEIIDAVNSWEVLCKKYNCTKANLAIAWGLEKFNSINVLCGARQENQIVDNIKSLDIKLEIEDVQFLEKSVMKNYTDKKEK